jgi:predicted DNA-binding ribbon-helix-helix protein
MGFAKMSITVPDEVYQELKEIASRKNMKLSHLVSDALVEMTRRMKEDSFVRLLDEIYSEPEVGREQREMAELIAENTSLEELPW